MSTNQSGEGEIRKSIVEAGVVDCMVDLPGQHPNAIGPFDRKVQTPEIIMLLAR
jgi:hypothetical protein